jgi:hypothetical protein
MALEYWHPARRRWILYRSQDEHSRDCQKYPYDRVPRRIFLDTNIVNLMIKQRESVFEEAPIADSLEHEAALDTEALMHVCSFGIRAPWTMVACTKSLEELAAEAGIAGVGDLLDYALEVVTDCGEDATYAAELGRRIADSELLAALPDRNDRELLGNAIGLHCDAFCTRDHRTIIRKRELLPDLPIQIVTPREWWSHVKPWGALFA